MNNKKPAKWWNYGEDWPEDQPTRPVCGHSRLASNDPGESKDTSANKADQGKPRFDLIPAWPLEQLAAVMTYGAVTYGDHNWRRGMPYSKLYAAAHRHMNAFWAGEDSDIDSGLPHLAHAAANMLMLLDYDYRGYDELGLDDRLFDAYTVRDIRAMIQEGTL